MFKKIVAFGLIVVMCLGFLSGCAPNPNRYTDEEHIQRISERIENKFVGKTGVTGFSVYPLYNQNDERTLFLVEFEPVGFMFVQIRQNITIFNSAMYSHDANINEPWQRYTVTKEGIQWMTGQGLSSWPDEYKIWETDENGEHIYYEKSYFHAAGIENEKRYLLGIPHHVNIPAVKREGKWLNLISMEEIDLEVAVRKYPDFSISFIPKPLFDL